MNSLTSSKSLAPHRESADLVPLPSLAVSTAEVEPERAFDFWCDQFRLIKDLSVPRNARAKFSGESVFWQLGSMVVGRLTISERRIVRTPVMCARDSFDHWDFRVLLRGEVILRNSERTERLLPGQLQLESFSEAYDDLWGDSEWVSLVIARDAFPSTSAGLERLPRGVLHGPCAKMFADFMVSLALNISDFTTKDIPIIERTTRHMINACILAYLPDAANLKSGREVLQYNQVRRAIDENIGSARLSPRLICELTGLSRSTLYRMFGEADGGVAAYIQRRRLQLVLSELEDPRKLEVPIARIAESWGLFCVPSFNRAFRREYGMTPREARAAAIARGMRSETAFDMPVPGREADYCGFLRTTQIGCAEAVEE